MTTTDNTDNTHRMSPAEAEKQQGCWLEGSRGWTASGELVNIADRHGMPLDDDDRAVVEAYLDEERTGTVELSTGELVGYDEIMSAVADQDGLAEKAEKWLNENVAPDGWAFGWRDGEFFLWSDSEWEADD